MMKRGGFTSVELIIGIAAGAVVVLMVWALFGPVSNWMFAQYRRGGFVENAAAISMVNKEVRRVKAPGQILIWEPEHLRFVDIDENIVEYQISGSDLMRGEDALLRNVQSIQFAYLDKDGSAAAINSQIRVISVKLVITSGAQSIALESAERIRNIP